MRTILFEDEQWEIAELWNSLKQRRLCVKGKRPNNQTLTHHPLQLDDGSWRWLDYQTTGEPSFEVPQNIRTFAETLFTLTAP